MSYLYTGEVGDFILRKFIRFIKRRINCMLIDSRCKYHEVLLPLGFIFQD